MNILICSCCCGAQGNNLDCCGNLVGDFDARW
jgi:hypothetical protein